MFRRFARPSRPSFDSGGRNGSPASARNAAFHPQRFFALLLVLALLLPLLAACAGPQAAPAAAGGAAELKGTITASGAFALYPLMVQWGEEFSKLHPGVQFDISAGGAGKGMADALAGAVDIGMVSRGVTPEEEGKGAWWVAVTKDAVLPMVNAQNPVLADLLAQGVTQEEFEKIWITGEMTTWGQLVGKPEITEPINVYTRSDAAGAPETWAKYLGNKKQENLKGIAVFGDPGLLDAVIKDRLGIGFNNLAYAFDNTTGQLVPGAVAIPVDANADGKADDGERLETKREAIDAVASGKYPSPPARALNLVTKDAPSPLVAAFIKWVLTDGQKYVDEAGYVTLPEDVLKAGLEKVK
jgi:phosphate transport system substrate-binding protein